jgi:hypothetical protein
MSSGTWSVRVVDERGHGVSGAKVSYQCGRLSGVGTEHTDGDGWATFELIEGALGGGAITVYDIWIDGESVLDSAFTPSDGDTFSFSRP